MTNILTMFDGQIKGVYGNHTCLSLQTSIDEDDENLTTAHHRHLSKSSTLCYSLLSFVYITRKFFAGLQNLCISSSLVCVIILLASLVVFWVGFILRQVPPVLIVSVLYVLAGTKTKGHAGF